MSLNIAYLIEPPFNYRDGAGGITGCDVDLARQVFRICGLDAPRFTETEFADLLPGLQRGAWQMTTGLFATEARRAEALFSRPIWALPDGLLVRADCPGHVTGYRALAADPALRLATIRDQAQHAHARDLGVQPDQIAVFETYPEAADAVRTGRVAAYASVARAHDGYLAQNPESGLEARVIPTVERPPAFGAFAISKTRPDLHRAVDGALSTFLGSKSHRQMMRTYGFSKPEIDLLPT